MLGPKVKCEINTFTTTSIIMISSPQTGTSPLALCSLWQGRSWTCMTQPTWERSWACTSSRSCLVCLCTALSCCLSSSSSLLAKIPSPISEGCCRLSSSHWPRHPGKRRQVFSDLSYSSQVDVAQSLGSLCFNPKNMYCTGPVLINYPDGVSSFSAAQPHCRSP